MVNRRSARLSWIVAAGAVITAPLGCGGSQASQPKIALYETCPGGDDSTCQSGLCLYVGAPTPYSSSCTKLCAKPSDCPPLADGSAALCIDRFCRTPVCDSAADPGIYGIPCVDGRLRACAELAAPPCPRCGCTPAQFCDSVSGTCLAKKESGQPCTDATDCQSGSCQYFVAADGTRLFDGKRYCMFPYGAPCWPGDPCNCDAGACTFVCIGTDGSPCVEDTVCLFQDPAGERRTCRRSCATDPTVCGSTAICADISLSPSFGPVYACAAAPGSPRPPRPEGVPCQSGTECISGTCCPPAMTETWGHCAGASGC